MQTTKSRSTSSSPRNPPWHLGNTTVRTPFRLADALRILSESEFNGDLADEPLQIRFGERLFEEGYLRSVADDAATAAWNARKWRSAMYQLGFITPALVKDLPPGQVDIRISAVANGMPGISGKQYEITPSGLRLARADSVVKKQECFLRSILAYRVPSPIEKTHNVAPFSPLRVTLKTLLELEAGGHSGRISFEEMASLVQFCKSEKDVPALVSEIVGYRKSHSQATNKRGFDREYRDKILIGHGSPVKSESLDDYADVNFRYLKATGLLSGTRGSIILAADKRREIELIMALPDVWPGDDAYLRRLWDGAALPTDDLSEAGLAIRNLERELGEAGRSPVVPSLTGLPAPELEQIRLGLEETRRILREEQFAQAQRAEFGSIHELLVLMDNRRERSMAYAREAPAYLEWIFWRAFLAINTLTNKPWEVRQFAIGADLNPLSNAPSRRPDIICEFQDFALVVEVTFTENSRQEAAEGEPVRRHVADVTQRYLSSGKPVYGLFVAPKIDPNTAETFGHGTFVIAGERIDLNIVPVTLAQFASMFEAGFSRPHGIGPDDVRSFLDASLRRRSEDGETWKAEIEALVNECLAGDTHIAAGG
jgi:hypothetical protein